MGLIAWSRVLQPASSQAFGFEGESRSSRFATSVSSTFVSAGLCTYRSKPALMASCSIAAPRRAVDATRNG